MSSSPSVSMGAMPMPVVPPVTGEKPAPLAPSVAVHVNGGTPSSPPAPVSPDEVTSGAGAFPLSAPSSPPSQGTIGNQHLFHPAGSPGTAGAAAAFGSGLGSAKSASSRRKVQPTRSPSPHMAAAAGAATPGVVFQIPFDLNTPHVPPSPKMRAAAAAAATQAAASRAALAASVPAGTAAASGLSPMMSAMMGRSPLAQPVRGPMGPGGAADPASLSHTSPLVGMVRVPVQPATISGHLAASDPDAMMVDPPAPSSSAGQFRPSPHMASGAAPLQVSGGGNGVVGLGLVPAPAGSVAVPPPIAPVGYGAAALPAHMMLMAASSSSSSPSSLPPFPAATSSSSPAAMAFASHLGGPASGGMRYSSTSVSAAMASMSSPVPLPPPVRSPSPTYHGRPGSAATAAAFPPAVAPRASSPSPQSTHIGLLTRAGHASPQLGPRSSSPNGGRGRRDRTPSGSSSGSNAAPTAATRSPPKPQFPAAASSYGYVGRSGSPMPPPVSGGAVYGAPGYASRPLYRIDSEASGGLLFPDAVAIDAPMAHHHAHQYQQQQVQQQQPVAEWRAPPAVRAARTGSPARRGAGNAQAATAVGGPGASSPKVRAVNFPYSASDGAASEDSDLAGNGGAGARAPRRRAVHHSGAAGGPDDEHEHTGPRKTCRSCGATRSAQSTWRTGWNDVTLCNQCGLRFNRNGHIHCRSCNYIPTKSEASGPNPKCRQCSAPL
ncbi:hypothetical protein BC828DRAFT_407138 [Blastocladiella britannica]|nr:hypothetical protein BC828DRAFT_407138 [Blastocladiella britannica]